MVKRAKDVGPLRLQLAGGELPLHLQLYERLRQAVLGRQLKPGARLPSSRALALELALSRTTVLAAYDQLAAEGYLESRVGAGTRVAAELPDAPLQAADRRRRGAPPKAAKPRLSARVQAVATAPYGPELRLPALASWQTAFRVAVPALDHFPAELWARLVATHARRKTQELMDYQHPRGLPQLRSAIAEHLAVTRGVSCTAEQVMVTAGAQSAIDLVFRVLLEPGDRIWLEDPGHLGARGAAGVAGARVAAVPVDAEGLDVAAGLALAPDARLAFVTPSNQFPLAVTMSLARRLALLDWAASTDAWVLEDDYDSEFRFQGRPLEALQALDRHGRVLYVGSFSKVLFPGLRLGYLIVPPPLVDAFVAARRFLDVHAPSLTQAVLADFIAEGHFARHLRRMRRLYGERWQALRQAAERHLAGLLTLAEVRAGMHAVGWVPEGCCDREAARRAAAEAVEVRPLSLHGLGPTRPGLVLGFGAVTTEEIGKAAQRLARALA